MRDSGILGGILSLRKKACHATPLSFYGSSGGAHIPYIADYFDQGELAVLHIAQKQYGILSCDSLDTIGSNQIRFIEDTQKIWSQNLLHHLQTRFDAHDLVIFSDKEITQKRTPPEAVRGNFADICIGDQQTADNHNLCFTPLETEHFEILLMKGYSEDHRIVQLIESVRTSTLIQQLHDAGFDTSRTGTIREIR